ncbi:MAG: hypothetical protein K2Q12_00495 [Rickettsiales bacterium]|nr:hypothetical protein [Rickettsiales bacterium]
MNQMLWEDLVEGSNNSLIDDKTFGEGRIIYHRMKQAIAIHNEKLNQATKNMDNFRSEWMRSPNAAIDQFNDLL